MKRQSLRVSHIETSVHTEQPDTILCTQTLHRTPQTHTKTELRQALIGAQPEDDPSTAATQPTASSRKESDRPRDCYGCPALDYELNYAGPVGQVRERVCV